MSTPLQKLKQEIAKSIAETIDEAAILALADIRLNAPYRTGNLINSWQRVSSNDKARAIIDSTVPYRFAYYPLTSRFGRRVPRFPLLLPDRKDSFEERMKTSLANNLNARINRLQP